VVTARASVKPDYLVCMECGKKQKTVRRHLQTAHRADYGLPRGLPDNGLLLLRNSTNYGPSIELGRKGRGSRLLRLLHRTARPHPRATAGVRRLRLKLMRQLASENSHRSVVACYTAQQRLVLGLKVVVNLT
jgi:hypothetical protein